MRIVSFLQDGASRWGCLGQDDQVVVAGQDYPSSVLDLIASAEARGLLERLLADPKAERLPLDSLNLQAPIPQPRRNVICLGLNYSEHARESAEASGRQLRLPEHPVVFTKNVGSVNGPYSDVILDPRTTAQLDWEVELAFVIGRGGRHIPEETALSHVFGYMVLNDLSARDVQFRHKQFFLGKSLDGACPMGPALVTSDEVPDPQRLALRCRVNGVLKQESNTSQQIFPIARTIATLSQVMSLEPGDIVATGTPEGVGFARTPPEFLQVGDVVECEVEGLGQIRNRIVAAD